NDADDGPGAWRLDGLKDALATLNKDQREVLVLRHFAGLSPPEIASITGRTEGSINGLHHRGRRALQSELIRRRLSPVTGHRSAATSGNPRPIAAAVEGGVIERAIRPLSTSAK